MNCSFEFDVGGTSCFVMVETSLMYPVFNSFGTQNYTSFDDSVDVGAAPDWSSMYCDCSRGLSNTEKSSCNQSFEMNICHSLQL